MVRLALPSLVGLWLLLCLKITNAFSTISTGSAPSFRSALTAVPSGNADQGGSTLHQRRDFVIKSITAGVVSNMIHPIVEPALADDQAETSAIDPSIDPPKITQKVYLDIKFVKYTTPTRLVIGLFGDAMPRTVENFLALCSNTDGPTYSGTSFYRVLSGMSIQGGAIGNSNGKSGTSAFEGGKPFTPDNFNIRHTKTGLVSAVRTMNGEIDSRFFIQTEADAGWADDRYAAFGVVLEEGESGGMDLVRRISRVDVKTPQNSPNDPITIVGCGIVEG